MTSCPSRLPQACLILCAVLLATPLAAQDRAENDRAPPGLPPAGPPPSVFDGDHITVGIGVGLSPSYSGSDDYVVFPLPVITGSFGGIDFNPRPAGIAVDFVADRRGQVSFDLGAAVRVRSDRADRIEDQVVRSLGKLDRAVEVGPSAGISVPGIFSRFDSISFSIDALWDIAGAHDGMSVAPSLTYTSTIGRSALASLSLGASIVDDSFADYYYSISPAQALTSGLPIFTADGGLESIGANIFLAVDLNGNARDGGWSVIGIGGYSRLVGDASRTPLTKDRGSPDQFLLGAGVGYTF